MLRAFACEGVARQSKDPLGVATTLPVQELKPGCGFQGSRIMADASATTPKVWVKVVLESAGREPYTLLPVSAMTYSDSVHAGSFCRAVIALAVE